MTKAAKKSCTRALMSLSTLRFTEMCAPSELDAIIRQPMPTFSLAASRASHLARLVSAPERMMTAICGQNLPGSLAKFDPARWCWKTSAPLQLHLWDSPPTRSPSLESLPLWGMTHNGELFALPKSAPRTNGRAGGVWPIGAMWATPAASDDKNRAPSKTPHLTSTGTLRHMNAAGQQSFMRLSQQMKAWGTPVVSLTKGGTPKRAETSDLHHQVAKKWGTPTANMHYGGQKKRKNQRYLKEALASIDGQSERTVYANPDWIELLMGLPIGWTDPDIPLDRDRLNLPTNHHGRYRYRLISVLERVTKRD